MHHIHTYTGTHTHTHTHTGCVMLRGLQMKRLKPGWYDLQTFCIFGRKLTFGQPLFS